MKGKSSPTIKKDTPSMPHTKPKKKDGDQGLYVWKKKKEMFRLNVYNKEGRGMGVSPFTKEKEKGFLPRSRKKKKREKREPTY